MNDVLLIVLFASIAALFALRLYTVLGRRNEDEPAMAAQAAEQAGALEDHPSDRAFTGPGAAAMEAIREAEGGFDPEQFLGGAGQAYGLIGKAFAEGDRETLETLLTPAVFSKWSAAIAAREEAGRTQTFELSEIQTVTIDDGEVAGDRVRLSVEFTANIASSVRDAEGEIIEGDPEFARRVDEVWTFERKLGDPNPNWYLARVSAS